MRMWTLNELFRLTRAELLGLHREIIAAQAVMRDTDPGRTVAHSNLRSIRRALARPSLKP